MIELRCKSTIPQSELDAKVGKIVTDADYNVLLTGACRLRKPDGALLAVYLPGTLRPSRLTYEILHSLRGIQTDNRGEASGSRRFRYGEETRTRSAKVRSAIIGAFDPGGPKQFCRLTGWTGHHLPRWRELQPFFQDIAEQFEKHAPERYKVQADYAAGTHPDWVIPNTPFTTITVNNTYPTGVHTDSGDLERGFSTMAVLRRGDYTGGRLVLPKFRVAVDMQDGDLILFDAHEFHGNTLIETRSPDAERISVVSYYRTRMAECGSAEDEYRKAVVYAERRGGNNRTEQPAEQQAETPAGEPGPQSDDVHA